MKIKRKQLRENWGDNLLHVEQTPSPLNNIYTCYYGVKSIINKGLYRNTGWLERQAQVSSKHEWLTKLYELLSWLVWFQLFLQISCCWAYPSEGDTMYLPSELFGWKCSTFVDLLYSYKTRLLTLLMDL